MVVLENKDYNLKYNFLQFRKKKRIVFVRKLKKFIQQNTRSLIKKAETRGKKSPQKNHNKLCKSLSNIRSDKQDGDNFRDTNKLCYM